MSKILWGMFLFLLAPRVMASTSSPLRVTDFAARSHEIKWDAEKKKGTVLIFLSSVCPCSQSHEKKIASLIRRYPEFQFVGVHSNTEEELAYVKSHFEKAAIPFHAFANDRDQALANRYGALKTPHAFILDRSGNPLYRGGVDNSHDADKASVEYLENALQDINDNRPVKLAETKPLGCVISR